MKLLQQKSNLLKKYSKDILNYLAIAVIAVLPFFIGQILFDKHSYIFGTHINYLHIRITLHDIVFSIFLFVYMYVRKKDIFNNSYIRFLIIISLATATYSGIRAFESAALFTEFPLVYALTSSIGLLQTVIKVISVILAIRIVVQETTIHKAVFKVLFVSTVIQLILGTLQIYLNAPVYPNLLSWSGQPIDLTSFSYIGTTIWARAYGTTPHPNILGGTAALFLFISLSLELPKLKKLILALSTVFLIAISFSKAAWFLGAILLIIYLLKAPIENLRFMITKQQILSISATSQMLLVLFFWWAKEPRFYQSFIISRARIQEIYFTLLTHFKSYIMLGTGFKMSIPTMLALRAQLPVSTIYINRILAEPAHNIFLLTGIELGFPIALGIWIVTFWLFFRQFKPFALWQKLSLIAIVMILGGVDHWMVY